MDPHETTPQQDKQITVAVPEDRVPEFYAMYGHFLAGRRGGPGRHGRGPGRGRCGHHGPERSHEAPGEPQAATS